MRLFHPVRLLENRDCRVAHELVMEVKFRNDWVKIVDFLLIAYFWACVIFYYSVSKFEVLSRSESQCKCHKDNPQKEKYFKETFCTINICKHRSKKKIV